MELRLCYGAIVLGTISDIVEHQGTWSGQFRRTLSTAQNSTEQRLDEFIEFCSDWHSRLRDADAADASEFDRFRDVFESGLWYTEYPDGTVNRIADAPVFMDGWCGEISWRADERVNPLERVADPEPEGE